MTTKAVERSGGVSDSAVTGAASDPGEPVRRPEVPRCGTCGTPLTEDGLVDLAALDSASADLRQVRALHDERADIERRLARADAALKTAARLKDEPARVAATRAVESAQGRLVEVDRILAAASSPEIPTDGPCPACKTIFRGGRVDRAAATRTVVERREHASQVAALETELRYARATVTSERHAAEVNSPRDSTDPQDHRDRAEQNEERIPAIEAALARAKEELGMATSRKAAGSRK